MLEYPKTGPAIFKVKTDDNLVTVYTCEYSVIHHVSVLHRLYKESKIIIKKMD